VPGLAAVYATEGATLLRRLRRINHKAAAPMSPSITIPATTPPATAPTLVLLDEAAAVVCNEVAEVVDVAVATVATGLPVPLTSGNAKARFRFRNWNPAVNLPMAAFAAIGS
jgi:hypothetical protein